MRPRRGPARPCSSRASFAPPAPPSGAVTRRSEPTRPLRHHPAPDMNGARYERCQTGVMRPTRRGSVLVTAAVIAMLLAGCTSGTVRSSTGKPGPTTRSGHTSARPNGPSTSSATSAAGSVLNCNEVGVVDEVAPLQVVLGVVALPISPRYPALGTSVSGDGNGPLRLFAKTGLFFRPGTTFELIVPARFASRLRIGWGTPGTPSQRVEVSNCANPGGGGWLAIAGGYWIDHPACVPIIVRAGGKQQQVHIGVGKACPGQRPPQGPSQS